MKCPNCDAECVSGATLCPNCGCVLSPVPRVVDRRAIAVGFIVGAMLFALLGIGILINPILCLIYWKTNNSFARGILGSIVVLAVCMLGFLMVCGGPMLFYRWGR